jgi:site-specific recombinase XerD
MLELTSAEKYQGANLNTHHSFQTHSEDVPEMSVFDAVEPFLLYCRVERQYAEETQSKIKESFRSWLLRHFGSLKLSDIKPMNVLSFRQAMAAKNLSIARQYGLLMILKLFLKFCRTVLEINCLDPSSIRLPRRKTPQVEYLTNAEIEAMRESIDSSRALGVRTRAIFETLLASGMRISELLSLNRDSIDPATKEAIITGKGSRMRTVFFTDESLKWIQRYLSFRKDNRPALFVTYGEKPMRLRRGDIPRFFETAAKLAGIEKRVTPHLLRHTFCTNLRNNGADISLIKDLAGHADIQTTARYYLGSNKQILHEAVQKYLSYSNEGVSNSDKNAAPEGGNR